MTKEVSEAPRSLLSQMRESLLSSLLRTGSLRFQNPWFWGPVFYTQLSSLFAFDYGRREIVHPQAGLLIAFSFVGYWLLYPVLAWLVSRAAEKTKWLWVVSGLLILGVSRGYLIEHLYETSEAEALTSFLARLPGDITIGFIIVIALSELIYSSDTSARFENSTRHRHSYLKIESKPRVERWRPSLDLGRWLSRLSLAN